MERKWDTRKRVGSMKRFFEGKLKYLSRDYFLLSVERMRKQGDAI